MRCPLGAFSGSPSRCSEMSGPTSSSPSACRRSSSRRRSCSYRWTCSFDSFLSAVVVTEVTLLANFALNDAFVFGADGKRGNPLHHRLLKYHASRALSIAVNLVVFYVLNKVLLVNHLLATSWRSSLPSA